MLLTFFTFFFFCILPHSGYASEDGSASDVDVNSAGRVCLYTPTQNCVLLSARKYVMQMSLFQLIDVSIL